jgi:hypothetical protein
MADDFTAPPSEAIKAIVESATDASTLQQALHDSLEQDAARLTNPTPAPVVPPYAPAESPSNLRGSFYRVLYKGNSRLEVVESTCEAFAKAMDNYRRQGWVG